MRHFVHAFWIFEASGHVPKKPRWISGPVRNLKKRAPPQFHAADAGALSLSLFDWRATVQITLTVRVLFSSLSVLLLQRVNRTIKVLHWSCSNKFSGDGNLIYKRISFWTRRICGRVRLLELIQYLVVAIGSQDVWLCDVLLPSRTFLLVF
jgi:hypothetical protein